MAFGRPLFADLRNPKVFRPEATGTVDAEEVPTPEVVAV